MMRSRTEARATLGALILLTAASCGSVACGSDNWPSFRGPTDQGLAAAADPPVRWSETEHVVWKTPIDGKAWSSPVIWGDRLWVTNAPEAGTQLLIYCLNKDSGDTIYRKGLRRVVAPQYCHPFNSYASPSPVVEDGRVYVSFGSPYNGCLDATTGDVIWERTDLVCNHFRGAGSSPFLYKHLVIQHMDGSDRQYVVAMDKDTGKTVWTTDRSVDFGDIDPRTGQPRMEGDLRKAFSTPLLAHVNGRPVLISLGSMALYGYDPDNGKELWRVEAAGSHSGSSRPILGGQMVYSPMGMKREFWAIRPDGSGVVTDSHVEWTYKGAVPSRSSVVLVNGLIFMVSDTGIAACLEAQTGEELWMQRLNGNFSASPIHAAGKIYFFDEDGKTTVIEASRKYRVVAVNQLDDGFMASPAVSGNTFFLRTRTHLYRIEQ